MISDFPRSPIAWYIPGAFLARRLGRHRSWRENIQLGLVTQTMGGFFQAKLK